MNVPGRSIRVAHVITKMAVGGAQESAITTCTGLDQQRFEQVLFSGAEVDSEGSLLDDARRRGVEVLIEESLVRPIRPWRDLRAVWRLSQQFRAWKPDIVHTHSSKAGFVGRLAARAGGVRKVVHSVHGWSFHDEMGRGRAVIVRVERLAAKLTDALVVESSTDLPKGLSRRIGRARQYTLIRNGIDLSRFRQAAPDRSCVRRSLGVPEGTWLIGTIGRLADQKDPLLMVDAFAKVATVVPEAQFVWVGDGPLRAETEKRAGELGLSDRFHLVGLRRDVPDVLSVFDVFALSSRWEGLPRTITEAMASGVPVVATSVDGTAEVIVNDHTGLLVPSGDADRLAAAIVSLHDDPPRASRLAEAGRERAGMFSREAMSADLADLYERLVSGAPVPRARRPLRVTHVITGLGYGGAERQLQGLIRGSDPHQVVHEVVSLTELGSIGEQLATSGVSVTALGMEPGHPRLRALLALRRHLAQSGADVVQTWLYHADLLGGLAARSVRLPVVWNVRMTWMDASTTKASTMSAARWGARLSGAVPRQIVFNSAEGMASHRRHGYSVERGIVLENGIDLDVFRPDSAARASLRQLLGVGPNALVVGVVARSDPQKGHDVLLAAMRTVLDGHPEAHLVLIGRGCSAGDEPISTLARAMGSLGRVHLLGPRSDVASLTAGFDVAVSASTHGESYSNAVVEALACGIPVVATTVGAARELVGSSGRVVPPGSASELAAAISDLLAQSPDERQRSGLAGRERLRGRGFRELSERYAELYETVLAR